MKTERAAKIKNLVEVSTKQSTKILLGELLIQADINALLTAQLDEQDNHVYFGGPPSMVNTDTSSVMSQQNQAMQVEINTLKAAAMAALIAVAGTPPPA